MSPELQVLKNVDELKNINKEKCNIFSLGLICLNVSFEEIAKLKQNINPD